jgi:hypothetical protein
MEADFAQWRVWAANIRDGHLDGHPLAEKARLLCLAMDAWHNAWLLQRRPHSAQNLTRPLEDAIEMLVVDLIRLGVSPPARPADTRVKKNTMTSRHDQH